MTAQNQRDPDSTDILGQVRDGLADLKANVISRWGRVPHVAADPSTLADGMVWVRSDLGVLKYRASSVTYPTLPTTFTVVRRGGGVADTIGTGGSVQNSGRYQIDDGRCYFSITWVFGAAAAVANAGVTTFDAPVAFGASNDSFQAIGGGVGIQAGARFNFQVIRDATANGFQLYGPAQVTQAVPGAVTFNDSWRFNGWYWV